ncbi:hypothetical protein [Undibacterium pigrum]|nr:hypothetical protein [Undibacterium pigrum]
MTQLSTLLDKYGIDLDLEEKELWYRERQGNEKVTDEVLKSISSVQGIAKLKLIECSNVSGTFLKDFPSEVLEEIHLIACPFSDEGCKFLPGFSRLKTLVLTGTEITDSGIPYIGQLESLERLQLFGRLVTDTGILQLAALNDLKILETYFPLVSKEAIDQLKKLLPNCAIVAMR